MPNRDRRVGEQDATPVQRFGIDRVVANAVARNHPQATAIARELSLRHLSATDQQRVVVSKGFQRELPALDRHYRPREPGWGKKRERR
jgi:hypothetical protein